MRGGTELDLFFTDPPYNVDIGVTDLEEAEIRHARKDGLKIQNDKMTDDDFYNFLVKAFKNATNQLKPGGAFYIWYASREHINFENALNESGLEVHEQLIWVKNTFTFSRQDYKWMHEPCLYGWKEGNAHYFIEEYNHPTIIREDKPVRSDLHPTMKPIKLCARLIQNSTKPGESVLDLFGGSGSTLIACEQLGRKCYMMEYDPHYVDVIINRWEDFTGEKAVKL